MILLHIGNHTRLSFEALMAHLLEPDHVGVLVVAGLVGITAYRLRRRVAARARVEAERRP